jgi:hypothetical protein
VVFLLQGLRQTFYMHVSFSCAYYMPRPSRFLYLTILIIFYKDTSYGASRYETPMSSSFVLFYPFLIQIFDKLAVLIFLLTTEINLRSSYMYGTHKYRLRTLNVMSYDRYVLQYLSYLPPPRSSIRKMKSITLYIQRSQRQFSVTIYRSFRFNVLHRCQYHTSCCICHNLSPPKKIVQGQSPRIRTESTIMFCLVRAIAFFVGR